MLLWLQLAIVFGQLFLARSFIYTEYPILQCYDGNTDIPEYARGNFEAVGIVVHKQHKVLTVGQNFALGDYTTSKPQLKLCDEILAETKSIYSAGTGFIISSNEFVTNYHVAENLLKDNNVDTVTSATVKDLRIIFGFRQKKTGVLMTLTSYEVEKISRERPKNSAEDWIVLKVTKGFTHNGGVKFVLADDIPVAGTPVYVLGHPLGMPLRYAAGKLAKSDDKEKKIKIWTSGFEGNSGSPIIRVNDGKVIGLFTDGPSKDLEFFKNVKKSCYDLTTKSSLNDDSGLISGPVAKLIRRNSQKKSNF